jgi:cytochrome c556
MRKTTVCGLALLAGAILATLAVQANDDKPKYTIREIMKKAHSGKTNLPKKLILGQINDDEKTKLIEYYEALGKNQPPKGSAEDWQKRTSKLLAAAKAAMDGGQAEKAKFRKAVDCASCHNAHKATDD